MPGSVETRGPALISQFRETLADLLPEMEEYRKSDWYLVKWLEEHNWDFRKSGAALRIAHKWRLETKMEHILQEDLSELSSRFPYENDGFDKSGLPILTVPFGRWKIKEAVEEGLREKFIRYAIQMTERNVQSLRKAVETSNGAVNQVIIIFDLSGYSFRQLMSRQTISTLSEWTKRSEEQYPQQLKNFYIINANKIMPILFSLLKPFMSANTVSRVTIFDSNQEEWEKAIFKNISRDQLSARYGGTRPSKIDQILKD